MYAPDHVPAATVSDTVIQAATVALSMLADPTRLRIMAHLVAGEQDVTALTAAVAAARPAVSQHLAKLRLAGLVTTRRDGRRSVYAVAGPHLQRLVTEALQAAEHQVGDPGGRSAGHRAQPDGGVDAASGRRA
jgi:DNA-binding transcriptional ArsR family regulator